jgi:hypothetical protein
VSDTSPLGADGRDALLERYRTGADVFEAVVAGAAPAELDARPFEGEWTVREIAHHLCDGELNSAIRIRRLIAEDEPVLAGYDENAFARLLHYGKREIAPSLAAMRAARDATYGLLLALTEDEWRRTGTHTEQGPYSVGAWLRDYANHPHDHAQQASRVLHAIRNPAGG